MTAQPGSAGPGRRRPSLTKGDLREQALLDAVESLLKDVPVKDLTVDAIAREAAVTRTAFYFYFASKEAAVGCIAERYLGEIFEAAQPVFDSTVPIELGLRRAIENQVEVWGRHGRALAAVADLAGSDPLVRDVWFSNIERFVDPVRARLEELDAQDGRPSDGSARQRSEIIVWMLERYYYVWASGHYRHAAADVSQTLYDVALRIVRPPAPQPPQPS